MLDGIPQALVSPFLKQEVLSVDINYLLVELGKMEPPLKFIDFLKSSIPTDWARESCFN